MDVVLRCRRGCSRSLDRGSQEVEEADRTHAPHPEEQALAEQNQALPHHDEPTLAKLPPPSHGL